MARSSKEEKAQKAIEPEIFLQYQGQQISTAEVAAKVKEMYDSKMHQEAAVESVQIYIKPQDKKVYYVINHEITGEFDLF